MKIGKHYQATQSYFPVSGPTNHLNITRPPVFVFFRKSKWKKMVYKQQSASHRFGHKTAKHRHLWIQNIEILDGEGEKLVKN